MNETYEIRGQKFNCLFTSNYLCLFSKMLPYLLFTFSHLDNRKKTSSQDKSLAPKLILASRKSGVVTQRQEAPEGNRFILVITMVYIRVGNWPTLGFSANTVEPGSTVQHKINILGVTTAYYLSDLNF